MFDRLGNFVARRWAWVLAAWVLFVPAILFCAPSWDSVSQDDDVDSFPNRYPSVVGHRLLKKAFPDDLFATEVVVALERRDEELLLEDEAIDKAFWTKLKEHLDEVQRSGERRDADGNILADKFGLSEFLTPDDDRIGTLLLSDDKHAALLLAPCQASFMAERLKHTVLALRREIKAIEDAGEVPPGLTVAVSGSGGVGADLQICTDQSLELSLKVTLVLVALILLLVYRSPVVALIPLITIGVSVVTSMSVMALMTKVPGIHFQVLKITTIFVVVVLFGAGTDYCLFLIARYREELEAGADRETAIRLAITHVGGALVASAATVVFGLGMMVFADFSKFKYTGPAVAISLAVALVGAMTLTPALLRMLGRFAFWPFTVKPLERRVADDGSIATQHTFQQRFWEGVSRWIAGRPTAIWATSVVILLPFFVWGWHLVPTYDFLSELDEKTGTRIGSAIIQRHFNRGDLGPLKVLVQVPDAAPSDLRSDAARDEIAELTRWILSGGDNPGDYYPADSIAKVRSLAQPLGEPEPELGERPTGKSFLDKLAATEWDARKRAQEKRRQLALEHYVSRAPGVDGRVTRLDVVFNMDPFSKESLRLRGKLDDLLLDFFNQSQSLPLGTQHAFAGITSSTRDLEDITQADQKLIRLLVVGAVWLILVVLLRRPMVCVYLMVTVLFGYYATLGMTEGVFRLLHEWNHPGEPWLGLDWKVSFFLFIILVAVGEDYNILLMSRVIEEEDKHGKAEGVRVAVARTGGIITSCGIIMAGTFGSMATGTLAAIIQLGFSLALGVMLDTFVVRPILVPAFLLMVEHFRSRFSPRGPADTGFKPHISARPAASLEQEPLAAHRRGLIALVLAWLGMR